MKSLAERFQTEKARRYRRGYSIRAYTGANGGGKTTCAVWDLLPSLDQGRPVLSTARLLDWRNPRPCDDPACSWPGHPDHGAAHPSWVPFTDWRQFLDSDLRDADILLDEVAGVASSRESGSLPFQVARELQKLRKRGITLSYTAPSYQRAEKILRECTQLLTYCQGRFSVAEQTVAEAAWRRNRLLSWKSYDAQEFEKFTSAERQQAQDSRGHVKVVAHQFFWLPGSSVTGAFDSLDQVLSLGWANESGICLECSGRRSVPRCKCSDHDDPDATPARRASAEDVAAGPVSVHQIRPRSA